MVLLRSCVILALYGSSVVSTLPVDPAIPAYQQYRASGFEPESCTTPSREKGWCLPINMCLDLYQILVTKPISQSNFELLRNSKCGFMATVPKVCCKDYPYPYPSGIPFSETISWTSVPTRPPTKRPKPTRKQPKTTTGLPEMTTGGVVPQIFAGDLNERVNQKPIINLLASSKDCGVEVTEKIFTGEVPQSVQYAFMALLEFTNDSGQRARCSGVLINNRHVLTSAHCVTITSGNWTLSHVRLGEYNTATELDCFDYVSEVRECIEAVTAAVEKVIVHEKYDAEDADQRHDIALVRLAQEVGYTEFIRPICIATTQQELKAMDKFTVPGERYKMIGWNRTANNLVKRVKTVTVVENLECEAKYKRKLDEHQLCGQSTKSNYPKDLKTPVLARVSQTDDDMELRWYLGGLSTYPNNPDNGALRIYTKASGYADWIIDKVQQSLR